MPDEVRKALIAALVAVGVLIAATVTWLSEPVEPPTSTTTTSEATTTTVAPTTTTQPDAFPDIPTVNVERHLNRNGWQPIGFGYPAFRMFCEFSHLGYEDPILAPGVEFAHLHMFFGNIEADRNSTWPSLRSSGDTTCQGGPINRTAYWFPAVFDSRDRVVAPDYFLLYYKAENWEAHSNDPADLQWYPNGLRMVAGAGWYGGVGQSVDHASTGGQAQLNVRFPYCWNGEDLWLPSGAHMSFGTGGGGWGACPSTHPVYLPELTEFAVFENVHEATAGWYLSSDRMGPTPAPNFSTLHADWFGAWDHEIGAWIRECLIRKANGNGGQLCDVGTGEAQLTWAPNYRGPKLLGGWTPTP